METGAGRQLWGERFERRVDDAFQLQDDIVASILEEADVQLLDGEQARTTRCQLYAGLPGRALHTARRALAMVPRPPAHHRLLFGAASVMAGGPRDAIPWLESTAREVPTSPEVRLWLAAAHSAMGQRLPAQAAARELLRLTPDFDASQWIRRAERFRRDVDRQRLREWLQAAGLRGGLRLPRPGGGTLR